MGPEPITSTLRGTNPGFGLRPAPGLPLCGPVWGSAVGGEGLLAALAATSRMPAAPRATFNATLERSDEPGSTGYVRVPSEVMAKLGTRRRMPVVVTIRGVSYRSTTSVYGGECYV